MWRFLPKGFESLYDLPDPAVIRQHADREIPLDQVTADWTIGREAARHANAIRGLFESGATIVNIHAGQNDQKKVIEFYRSQILPEFRKPAHS